jgi:hypothetical protein
MAYKIKKKKPYFKFSETETYYLVDVKENVYDPHAVKGWTSAVNLNMAYQMWSENPSVVPMPKKWVLQHKIKQRKFLAR